MLLISVVRHQQAVKNNELYEIDVSNQNTCIENCGYISNLFKAEHFSFRFFRYSKPQLPWFPAFGPYAHMPQSPGRSDFLTQNAR